MLNLRGVISEYNEKSEPIWFGNEIVLCYRLLNLNILEPHKSYRIWFSQRNGSSVLSKGLELTGVAGKPHELFNLVGEETLRQKHGAADYASLKRRLWEQGTSANGIFSVKHSMYTGRTQKIIEELKELRGISGPIDENEFWSDLFPNCKHIYLTRRNKIRQAVSWWKAIKDNVWHLKEGVSQALDQEFFETHYDFDAIHHLFREASLRECAIEDYYSRNNITPLTLVYEDFIDRFEETIKEILNFLEIEGGNITAPKYYAKTANAGSEIWVQRFRQDLQEKMGVEAW